MHPLSLVLALQLQLLFSPELLGISQHLPRFGGGSCIFLSVSCRHAHTWICGQPKHSFGYVAFLGLWKVPSQIRSLIISQSLWSNPSLECVRSTKIRPCQVMIPLALKWALKTASLSIIMIEKLVVTQSVFIEFDSLPLNIIDFSSIPSHPIRFEVIF